MSKRSKSKARHTSLRLPPDLVASVDRLSKDTGWSGARVVSHVAKLGVEFATGHAARAAEMVREIARAVTINRVKVDNARRLAAAQASLRAPRGATRSAGRRSAAKPGSTKPAAAAAADQPAK